MDLIYRAGEEVFEHRISRADWDLIQTLQEHLPDETKLLFIVPELGEEVHVLTEALRTAADRTAAFFAEKPHLLPYTYEFRCERPGDPRMTPGFSSGGMSGIQLPGDAKHYYAIWAGVNKCLLEKFGVGTDGLGFKVDTRDLRSERELMTTNLGLIAIRRTRARSELRKAVQEIQKFLKELDSEEVVKVVA